MIEVVQTVWHKALAVVRGDHSRISHFIQTHLTSDPEGLRTFAATIELVNLRPFMPTRYRIDRFCVLPVAVGVPRLLATAAFTLDSGVEVIASGNCVTEDGVERFACARQLCRCVEPTFNGASHLQAVLPQKAGPH